MSVQNEEFSEAVEIIRNALQDMEFGSITIMVQDGRIVSIESTEKFKVKLNKNPDLQTGHRHGIIIAKTKDVPNHVKEGEVKQK